MTDGTKSLFQRLQERRSAVSAGDPTGGDEAPGGTQANKRASRKQTSGTRGRAKGALTPEQRRAKIRALEKQLKDLE